MSKLPWFRAYHRMIDDERLRLLAFEDRWHFVAILCLKADGLLDAERDEMWERKVALKLGVQLRELDEIQRRLMSVGLIDGDWQPVKWDELQYKSDSSAKRMRDYRARKKNTKKQDDSVTQRNGDVTVTLQETDTDTDIPSKEGCAASDTPEDDFTFSDFEEAWAEVSKACGLPAMRAGARDRRRRAFGVRKRQYPDMADWQTAFATLRKARWMHGDNRKGWRCDADDFLNPQKFSRLVEGSYAETN